MIIATTGQKLLVEEMSPHPIPELSIFVPHQKVSHKSDSLLLISLGVLASDVLSYVFMAHLAIAVIVAVFGTVLFMVTVER